MMMMMMMMMKMMIKMMEMKIDDHDDDDDGDDDGDAVTVSLASFVIHLERKKYNFNEKLAILLFLALRSHSAIRCLIVLSEWENNSFMRQI